MANLKDLRNRIESVKSTGKITAAMKLVAASRLRRSQQLLSRSALYYNHLSTIIHRLLNTLKQRSEEEDKLFELPQMLTPPEKEEDYLLVVIASDRGLCGGYNINVVKEASRRISELKDHNVKVLCIGRKVRDILKRNHEDLIIHTLEGVASKGASYDESNLIANKISELITENAIDVAEIVYSRFHSAMNRELVSERFYPFVLPPFEDNVPDNINGAYFIHEPEDEEYVLEQALESFRKAVFFNVIINSQASEHGARMTSMDNATRNAGDMISKLTLKYNRIRQSAITTELTEIISGAEAI